MEQSPLVLSVRGKCPEIAPGCWLAPSAALIGDVTLGEESTVWFQAVVRGDVAPIRIGKRVNIQDGAVIHGTFGQSDTLIEDGASIGHNATVHGAHIGPGALIGMGAVVMDHAKVGAGAVVAAGAVVLAGTDIPEFTLWAGAPAQMKGPVREELRAHLAATANRYVEYAGWFKEGPSGPPQVARFQADGLTEEQPGSVGE